MDAIYDRRMVTLPFLFFTIAETFGGGCLYVVSIFYVLGFAFGFFFSNEPIDLIGFLVYVLLLLLSVFILSHTKERIDKWLLRDIHDLEDEIRGLKKQLADNKREV